VRVVVFWEQAELLWSVEWGRWDDENNDDDDDDDNDNNINNNNSILYFYHSDTITITPITETTQEYKQNK